MTDNTNESTNEQPTTGTAPGQQAGDTKSEKTFTQADLDNIVRDRIKKTEESILKKLGVTSIDEAKTATAKLKEIEDAQKTTEQKLQDELAEAKQRALDAVTKRKVALIRAAVIEAASKLVASDRIEAAYRLLDTSKLAVNDDDNVTGVQDALADLLKEHPFLKAEEPKPGSRLGATNPAGMGSPDSVESWHPLSRERSTGGFGGRIVAPKDKGTG